MRWSEETVTYDCAGQTVGGVFCMPETLGDTAVLIVVGGPQYRVGAHRSFVLLARALAAGGLASLRFDFRGMGDAGGEHPGFQAADDDLDAAQRALRARVPGVRRVVVWGLCDAASAIALWLDRRQARPAAVVLVNPWVRDAESAVAVEVKHYYGRRLLDGAFWRRLVRGEVAIGPAVVEAGGKVLSLVRTRLGGGGAAAALHFRDRMARGLTEAGVPVTILLSGRDLVADEFRDFLARHGGLQRLRQQGLLQVVEMPEADHTCSSAALRAQLAGLTLAHCRAGRAS